MFNQQVPVNHLQVAVFKLNIHLHYVNSSYCAVYREARLHRCSVEMEAVLQANVRT